MADSIFRNYDNPERAKLVWNDYAVLYTRSNLALTKAENIRDSCTKAEDLDLELDKLLCARSMHFVSSPPSPNDYDAQGYHTIALKILEDGLS